jgi:hypothetical protein
MANIAGFDMFNRLPNTGSGSSASFADLNASVASISGNINALRRCSAGGIVERIAGQWCITTDFKRDISYYAITNGA